MRTLPVQLLFLPLLILSFDWLAECAPPTCYSRVLELGKEIMDVLEKVHRSPRTVGGRCVHGVLMVGCAPPSCCSSLLLFLLYRKPALRSCQRCSWTFT